MKKFLEVGLGIIAALGGFVDIGDLVFASQAGAKWGLHLLWALALGTLMIILYAEMSGRVATVAKLPAFTIIRNRYPKSLDLITLGGSTIVNVMTCAAEIGGVALVLQLLSGLPYRALIIAAFLALILIIWLLPFGILEKTFGYLGLGLLVFAVVALKINPDWGQVGHGFIPQAVGSGHDLVNYAYFAVATIMIVAAHFFEARQISPEFINTPALAALVPFGQAGLLLVLLGMLFAIGGAVVETTFAGAYNISQYFNWRWGKHLNPLSVPRFTWTWLIILAIAFAIIIAGFDPITVTEYAVIFSVVVMPLTYLPILLAANDKRIMGKYKNKTWNTVLGWVFFAIIVVVSLAAVPLMIFTQRGQI
jgi:manganese transport protein